MMEFFSQLDLTTAIFTIIVAPLGLFLGKIILEYLKEWSSYSLEGILYWLTRLLKHSVAGGLTLKRYCRLQLSGQNQFLHVPSTSDVKLKIDNAFITLTLEHKGTEKTDYSHADILGVSNRIRVIGDPGSGKSSLIKRLFRDACRAAIQHPLKNRIPIIVELKNLAVPENIAVDAMGKWFYEEIKTQVEKTEVYKMGECLDSYGKTSGLLLLLDGLDEVSTSNYPRVESTIKGLSEELLLMGSKNAMVLTMRSQFHQQVKESFRESFGQALFIKPFSPTDIYEFLKRWPFGEKKEKNVSRIYKDLTDRPTLREMCSNPLVLSMYVAEDQSKVSSIAPDTRTEFYAKITEELIIRRRLHQTGAVPGRITLRQQREKILGTLAYTHLLNPDQATNSLDWQETARMIENIMQLKPGEGEGLLREIAKETGLLVEERPGETFRFIHLTFCEYLAAFEAVQGQENGWAKLIQAHRKFQKHPQHQFRSRLSEVIPFACGLLPRIERPKAITEISGLNNNLLLERCFLETKLYDQPSWETLVHSETQRLLETPEELWDSSWLQELHLFSVVAQDASQCATHDYTMMKVDINEFFQNLVDAQQKNLSVVLAAQASQDAAAVFQIAEHCNIDLPTKFPEIICSNCDQAPFFALVKEKALEETQRISLWSSLIVEAALRSKVVAEELEDSTSLSELNPYSSNLPVPMVSKWGNSKDNLYAQLSKIAIGENINSGISLPFLANTRSFSQALPFWTKHTLLSGPSFLFFLIFTLVGVTSLKILDLNPELLFHSTFSFLIQAILFFSITWLYFSLIGFLTLQPLCREVLNLGQHLWDVKIAKSRMVLIEPTGIFVLDAVIKVVTSPLVFSLNRFGFLIMGKKVREEFEKIRNAKLHRI